MFRLHRTVCTRAYSSLTNSAGNPLPLDRIVLSGLKFFGFHGVLEEVSRPPPPPHPTQQLRPISDACCTINTNTVRPLHLVAVGAEGGTSVHRGRRLAHRFSGSCSI